MINCNVELCEYNKNHECTFIRIEIDSSGKCRQSYIPKEHDGHEIVVYGKTVTKDTSVFID